MATRRFTSRQVAATLETIGALIDQGVSVTEACRSVDISIVTYRRWRRDFGGMTPEQIERMRFLMQENRLLRREVERLENENLRIRAKAGGTL